MIIDINIIYRMKCLLCKNLNGFKRQFEFAFCLQKAFLRTHWVVHYFIIEFPFTTTSKFTLTWAGP